MEKVLCNGFERIVRTTVNSQNVIQEATTSTTVSLQVVGPTSVPLNEIEGFLQWYCAPDSWNIQKQQRDKDDDVDDNNENKDSKTTTTISTVMTEEGSGGRWFVEHEQMDSCSSTSKLVVYPPSKKDYWRKTYYEPLLIKDDAPFLFYQLVYDSMHYYTIETTFTLYSSNQFDQAGLMVRYDSEHWIKTGIEVVDAVPRLSCVVTNTYSDWSTQPYVDHTEMAATGDGSVQNVTCTIRIHCRGSSFVVEVRRSSSTSEWDFVRIAHMSRGDTLSLSDASLATTTIPVDESNFKYYSTISSGIAPPNTLLAGVYAACPVQQDGKCFVTFSNFTIRDGSSFDHTAE